jgi:hypothetical protein
MFWKSQKLITLLLALVLLGAGCEDNPNITVLPTFTPELPEPTATEIFPTETPTEIPATETPEPTFTPTPIPPTTTPTERPTATPTAFVLPPATLLPPPPPIASHNPVAEFIRGYQTAGGPPQYLFSIVTFTVPCESEWKPRAYNPYGPYYGLMQFDMVTWNEAGGGDIYDPYTQGRNTARIILTSNPKGRWPVCWVG